MALTATATQGFEYLRSVSKDEVLYLPADPGITVARGDLLMCAVGTGVVELCTKGSDPIGRADKSVVVPAASQAFPRSYEFDPILNGAKEKTLVPVRTHVSEGEPIYQCTFKNQADDTVISYTAATRAVAATTGHTADDRPNGGIVYFYTGVGNGEVNVVEDYDHTGGAAELLVILHRETAATIDTTTKYVVLTGEAATNRGITFMGRIDQADEDELTTDDGANDGDWVVFMDYLQAPEYLKNLTVPVIKRAALYTV